MNNPIFIVSVIILMISSLYFFLKKHNINQTAKNLLECDFYKQGDELNLDNEIGTMILVSWSEKGFRYKKFHESNRVFPENLKNDGYMPWYCLTLNESYKKRILKEELNENFKKLNINPISAEKL